jgi:hypothetical protein
MKPMDPDVQWPHCGAHYSLGIGATSRFITPLHPGLIESVNSVLGWAGLPHRHRQQRRDVVHHRLHAGPDRLKSRQSQQVEGCRPQRGYGSGAVASIAVLLFMELGVTDPVDGSWAPEARPLTVQWTAAEHTHSGVTRQGSQRSDESVGAGAGSSAPS